MIEARIIADSLSPQGQRLSTFVATFPRIVLSELNTHRMFSRNSASSRAIPFKKMLQMVQENPFIPIAWQKDHKGMQGTEYLNGDDLVKANNSWLWGLKQAIGSAEFLHNTGTTKQLCNRLLEPFMYHTAIITTSELENFFALRCPQYETEHGVFRSRKDATAFVENKLNTDTYKWGIPTDIYWLRVNKSQAEIHIQALAEAMWDAYNESKPKQLKAGEWHIPFGDNMDYSKFVTLQADDSSEGVFDTLAVKIATARCARVSYMTFDGKIDYEADIRLHDILLTSRHMSPFEHCARAMSDDEYSKYLTSVALTKEEILTSQRHYGWCRNFRGFIQYRAMVE